MRAWLPYSLRRRNKVGLIATDKGLFMRMGTICTFVCIMKYVRLTTIFFADSNYREWEVARRL